MDLELAQLMMLLEEGIIYTEASNPRDPGDIAIIYSSFIILNARIFLRLLYTI